MTEVILPTEQESLLARQSGEQLAALVLREANADIYLHSAADREETLALPKPVVSILLGALKSMADGNGVTITPVTKEFTTQKAADFLMVSRPFLIAELLDKGKIPYRQVGNRRRIRYADLLRYRQEEEQEIARRSQVMLELMEETENPGLYK